MEKTKTNYIRTDTDPRTSKKQIIKYLTRIGVFHAEINVAWDTATGNALVRFKYKQKEYEHRSIKQKRLKDNVKALAIFIHHKVIGHERGIEDFGVSMSPYLRIEGPVTEEYKSVNIELTPEQRSAYALFGLSELVSNDEVKKQHRKLAGIYHPDRAMNDGMKEELEKRMTELNSAYTIIKKQRGMV